MLAVCGCFNVWILLSKEALCFCLLALSTLYKVEKLRDDFYFLSFFLSFFLCNILLLLHDRIKTVNSCFCTYQQHLRLNCW